MRTVITATETRAVAAAAANFTLAMVANIVYRVVSTTNAWVRVGAAAAVGGATSTYLPAGQPLYISGDYGTTLSICRDTADGFASLSPVQE